MLNEGSGLKLYELYQKNKLNNPNLGGNIIKKKDLKKLSNNYSDIEYYVKKILNHNKGEGLILLKKLKNKKALDKLDYQDINSYVSKVEQVATRLNDLLPENLQIPRNASIESVESYIPENWFELGEEEMPLLHEGPTIEPGSNYPNKMKRFPKQKIRDSPMLSIDLPYNQRLEAFAINFMDKSKDKNIGKQIIAQAFKNSEYNKENYRLKGIEYDLGMNDILRQKYNWSPIKKPNTYDSERQFGNGLALMMMKEKPKKRNTLENIRYPPQFKEKYGKFINNSGSGYVLKNIIDYENSKLKKHKRPRSPLNNDPYEWE